MRNAISEDLARVRGGAASVCKRYSRERHGRAGLKGRAFAEAVKLDLLQLLRGACPAKRPDLPR